MELAPMLIGLLAVVAMVVPVMYIHNVQKKKDSKFLNRFLELSNMNNLNLNQHELWGVSYAIGIDKQLKHVFFMKSKDEKEQTLLMDLSEIHKCRVANKSRTIKTNAGSIKVIDKLELVFVNKNPQKPEKSMEFYDGEESLSLRGELPLVEKWCTIINSCIKVDK